MSAVLTNSNRVNIPAVCRIKDRGTATLISPGILLTSTHVLRSQVEAAHLSAVFFEGSKKKPVEVRLLPQQFFFAASYPDYIDYCLVACEQNGITNVTPVKLPIIQSDWTTVREGDTILVIQHPISDNSHAAHVPPFTTTTPSSSNIIEDGEDSLSVGKINKDICVDGSTYEVKRFEEVLRCRQDLFYLKAHGTVWTAGCPAFNDAGILIGMQAQVRHDGEGVVNRVVSIVSIVKHLFANKQLSRIQQRVTFEDLWKTWYVEGDISRILLIMDNFKNREIFLSAAEKLLEHATKPTCVEDVIASGGVSYILSCLTNFRDDEKIVSMSLRAIWHVSFGEWDCQQTLVAGRAVEMILDGMESYPMNEEIVEFGTVLMHNISTGKVTPNFEGSLGHRALMLVHAALLRFKETTVIQKFGFSFFTTLLHVNPQHAETLVGLHIIEHVGYLAEQRQDQVFLMEVLMHFIGELAQHKRAIEICAANGGLMSREGPHNLASLTSLLVDIMLRYQEMDTILLQGNRALWGIGNDPVCRAMILQQPKSYDALKLSLPALLAKARTM